MNLNEQFDAAVARVNELPAEAAAQHMTELYGLYKQATAGDVNMKNDEVDAEAADQANGPAGLSQAQWDSWNQYKGVPEEEAKRRYVAKAAEMDGGSGGAGNGAPTNAVATDARTNAPTSTDNGGLRGDLTEGAPYGGEDRLKDAQ